MTDYNNYFCCFSSTAVVSTRQSSHYSLVVAIISYFDKWPFIHEFLVISHLLSYFFPVLLLLLQLLQSPRSSADIHLIILFIVIVIRIIIMIITVSFFCLNCSRPHGYFVCCGSSSSFWLIVLSSSSSSSRFIMFQSHQAIIMIFDECANESQSQTTSV